MGRREKGMKKEKEREKSMERDKEREGGGEKNHGKLIVSS